MQLKIKVKDLENTNSFNSTDKLIVLTDENTNTSKNLDKSDLLTDIVSPDATNGLNIQNGGLYNKDVSNIIGDLSDLTTPVKSNIVNAVNSIQNTINTDLNKIGDLSNLTTTDKSNLVGAVNELYNSIPVNNDLSNLNTNGENRLHALKGYTESGQTYTDSQLYNDVYTQYSMATQTGTDLIITDNYTVVGTPTIVDGVASGFSTSNDIRTKGYLQTLGNADTWAIELDVTTPSTFSNYQYIMSGGATNSDFQGFVLGMNSGGYFRLFLGGNGTSWNIANSQFSDYTINANTKVKVRLEFSGSQYILSSRLTGQNWVTQKTITSNTKIFNSNLPILFGHNTANSSAYWRGSIDIYSIKVHTNDMLAYTPNLSVAYTLANTGAKIVNIDDFGGLQMLNNMSGGALYYTIDDTNSEAALPFGNVYGLINKRADGEWENLAGSNIELSTVTAINTYDIDISSYITSNLYDYEAVFDIDAKRTDNNSNATNYIISLLLGDGTAIANYSNTFYKAQSYGDQFSVLLPKNIRKIRLQISGYALSSHSLKLLAWRRKGGNY